MNRYKFDENNHVHLLDNKPLIGTSTIAGSVGKGSALTWWASGMAVKELGWTNPKIVTDQSERVKTSTKVLEEIKEFRPEQYLNLLDKAYKAHSKELKRTADKGVDLHAELERYVKSKINGESFNLNLDLKDQLIPFIVWCDKNVKKWLFSEVHVYSEELWTGGIIDAGYIDNNDEFVLADFKSGGAWLSGFLQCGGYARQLTENMGAFDENGKKVFNLNDISRSMEILNNPFKYIHSLAIFPFKGGFTEPVIIRGQTHKYMKGFECAVYNYKLQQEFERR